MGNPSGPTGHLPYKAEEFCLRRDKLFAAMDFKSHAADSLWFMRTHIDFPLPPHFSWNQWAACVRHSGWVPRVTMLYAFIYISYFTYVYEDSENHGAVQASFPCHPPRHHQQSRKLQSLAFNPKITKWWANSIFHCKMFFLHTHGTLCAKPNKTAQKAWICAKNKAVSRNIKFHSQPNTSKTHWAIFQQINKYSPSKRAISSV